MIRITHDTLQSLECLSAKFLHKKRTSKTEWKSFEFYSESSSLVGLRLWLNPCHHYEDIQKIEIRI